MLSDREQERLRQVELRLLAEDPGLARSFEDLGLRDAASPLQWVYAMPRWVYATVVVVAVVFGVLMLAVGAVGTSPAFAMLATMILLVARRRSAPGPGTT